MISILFVDDEPLMLRSIKRMLLPKAKYWKLYFLESGDLALKFLKNHEVDILVTDMRMPEMGGDELLAKVKEKYPHISRMVLSGHSDEEIIVRTTKLAHQYIAKPCDASKLVEIISRAANFRMALKDKEMIELVTKIELLPSPPEYIDEIFDRMHDEEVSLAEIGKTISKDMGMSSNILKITNSAFFSLPRHVSSVEEAVVLLGLDIVKALILANHIFSFFDFSKIQNFSYQLLWDHCLRTACMAREIAKSYTDNKIDIDNSFITGILHDIGKLVLGYSITDKYNDIIQETRAKNHRLWKIERGLLGLSHAEIGAYLIGLWGMDDDIVEAIRCHHEPSKFDLSGGVLTAAIHVADVYDHQITVTHESYEKPVIDLKYIEDQGFENYLDKWFNICKEIFRQKCGG